MNLFLDIRRFAATVMAAATLSTQLLSAGTQPVNSQEPPKGVSKSEWQSIRAEYERHRPRPRSIRPRQAHTVRGIPSSSG